MRINFSFIAIFAVSLHILGHNAVAGGKEDEPPVYARTTRLELPTLSSRQIIPSNTNATRPTPQASPFPPGFEQEHRRVELPLHRRQVIGQEEPLTISTLRRASLHSDSFRYNDRELSHYEVMKRAPKVWAIIFEFSKRNKDELLQQGWLIVNYELYEPIDELQKDVKDLKLKRHIDEVVSDVERHYANVPYRVPIVNTPMEAISGIASVVLGYLEDAVEPILMMLPGLMRSVWRVQNNAESRGEDKEMDILIAKHTTRSQREAVTLGGSLLDELNRHEGMWRFSTDSQHDEDLVAFVKRGIVELKTRGGGGNAVGNVAELLMMAWMRRQGVPEHAIQMATTTSWDGGERRCAIACSALVSIGCDPKAGLSCIRSIEDVRERTKKAVEIFQLIFRIKEEYTREVGFSSFLEIVLHSGLVDNQLFWRHLKEHWKVTGVFERCSYLLLIDAIAKGSNDLAKSIVDWGASLEGSDWFKGDALGHAIYWGSFDFARYLIGKGVHITKHTLLNFVNLDAVDFVLTMLAETKAMTREEALIHLLHGAVRDGRTTMLRYLLSLGADKAVDDRHGEGYALRYGEKRLQIHGVSEIVRMLKASLNARQQSSKP
jgi:hypothetical protein